MKYYLYLFGIVTLLSGCSEVLTSMASTSAISYSKVSIVSVRLDDFPPKQPSGLSWDPLGGKPDIYCTIKANEITTRREKYENTSVGSPLFWVLPKPILMNNLMIAVTVSFYDEDGDLSNDDYMGSVVMVPATYRSTYPKYPSSVTVMSTSAPYVKVTLGLRWE